MGTTNREIEWAHIVLYFLIHNMYNVGIFLRENIQDIYLKL